MYSEIKHFVFILNQNLPEIFYFVRKVRNKEILIVQQMLFVYNTKMCQ